MSHFIQCNVQTPYTADPNERKKSVSQRQTFSRRWLFLSFKKREEARVIIPESKMAHREGCEGRIAALLQHSISVCPPPFDALETGQHVPQISTKIQTMKLWKNVKLIIFQNLF
jgi:hypothetical protein